MTSYIHSNNIMNNIHAKYCVVFKPKEKENTVTVSAHELNHNTLNVTGSFPKKTHMFKNKVKCVVFMNHL